MIGIHVWNEGLLSAGYFILLRKAINQAGTLPVLTSEIDCLKSEICKQTSDTPYECAAAFTFEPWPLLSAGYFILLRKAGNRAGMLPVPASEIDCLKSEI